MATISLCIIVRDEETMLPACLASVAGVVDEIVLVDTGSRDGTLALARAAGARVFEQPWSDDFSAPRNLAIAESRGDWVLVLDADERLTLGAREALLAAVAADDFDCGMLPLSTAERLDAEVEAVVQGTDRLGDVAYLPRLMRRTPDLRFDGIVHENVGQWLFANARKAKLLPGIDIVHFGAVPDLRRLRDKSARNIRLLERFCTQHPGDLTPYGYLAHEYFDVGELARAREVADRGWAVLLGGAKTLELPVLRLVTARAWLEVQRGEPEAAEATLAVAVRLLAEHPDVFFIRGCAAEMKALHCDTEARRQELLALALADYELAIGCANRVYLQKFIAGGAGWAAQVRCGTVLLLLGRAEPALAAFERALAENGSAREASWGRVEALLAVGAMREAFRDVKPLLDERPDGWTLAAVTAEAVGSLDAMGQWLGKAQSLLGAGFVAPHRRELYHDALASLGSFLERPVSVPGPLGKLAALASGTSPDVVVSSARGLRDPIVRGMARRLVTQWLRSGKVENVERLVTPMAERVLPGVTELVTAVVDELSGECSP